mmetsp:Transcript_2962/g.8346  ORF Transcript_2962/g.8346 Transcript_2962/m.8346 type:complete len:106 (-) Transcript_2962:1077-1394(-)
MFAAFSARALDPPFSTVSMDSDDSVSTSPELPGEHLKALLAKQGVNAKKGLSFPHGGFATAGAAVFLEQEGLVQSAALVLVFVLLCFYSQPYLRTCFTPRRPERT